MLGLDFRWKIGSGRIRDQVVGRTDVQRRRHAKSGGKTPFESCCVRGKYLDHISVTANEESKNLGISFKKMSAAFS